MSNEPFYDEEPLRETAAEEEEEEETEVEKQKQARPFYKSKTFYIILAVFVSIIVIVVPVLLFVAFPSIAQGTINGSQITINAVNITNPNATSFNMIVDGTLTNTGPISATVAFDPLDINWRAPNDTLIKLGSIELPPVSAWGGSGILHSDSIFTIEDANAFTEFTKYMLSTKSFVWNMHGTATVSALGRSISGLHVDKDVTLDGFNGFPGVAILQSSFPDNFNDDGIVMNIVTKIPNSAPIAIQLGSVVFGVSYNSTYIGPVQAEGASLKPGDNILTLSGHMIKHTNPLDLLNLSYLLSAFVQGLTINTTVTGISAAPDGINQVPWLSAGLQSVSLTVPLNDGSLKATYKNSSSTIKKRDDVDDYPPQPTNPAPLNLITGITIGSLDLVFNASNPYTPTASSDSILATYQLPFGFDTNITAVSQNMTLSTDQGVQIGAIVSTTFGNATTNETANILTFTMQNSPLVVFAGEEALFQEFTRNLTLGILQSFKIVGDASVDAIIPIGPVVLSNLGFSATVNLTGLGGLNNPPPEIKSVDVVGGTTEGLQLSISVDMVNPSNLQISAGDVSFQLTYESEVIGIALLPNLTFYRGEQVVTALATFASAEGNGQALLNNFVSGQPSITGIQGFNGTTNITSLQTALPALNLSSQIPGLKDKLIVSASVSILPTTASSKIASAFVTLYNPFTAGFKVTTIKSSVTVPLGVIGNINVDISKSPITVNGHSKGQSSSLPLTMNLDPSFVASLVMAQAKANGLDTRPLAALLKLGGMSVSKRDLIERHSIFDGFNISKFVIDAFKNFAVTVDLQSTVEIGDYSTPLVYHQDNVPAITDNSITMLIPIVGQPIVQNIVSNSELSFSTILISNATNSGFSVHIVGKINNTGPIAASISFPGGVGLYWSDTLLGIIEMGDIETEPDVGADIDMDAIFTVTNAEKLEAFSEVLLLQDKFTWTLVSNSVSVNALGFTFTGIQLEKDVTLKGFSGFAPFSDGKALNIDPKSFALFEILTDNAIGVRATASLRTRSNVGITASVVFENYFASTNVDLGFLAGTDVTIEPNPADSESIISTLSFVGRLVEQTSEEGVATIEQLFNQYLKGNESVLYVEGVSCSGSKGKVDWLSEALTKVRIDNVTLPGINSTFQLIQSVNLDNAEFDFITGSDYSPIVSSTSITAGIQLPFPIYMDINKVKQDLILEAVVGTSKIPVAAIQTDYVDAQTIATGPTTGNINFGISKDLKIPLAVFPNSKSVFELFNVALTVSPNISFWVAGSVDSHITTKIASFVLTNVTVNVQSELAGFNNLDGVATVKSLSVDGGNSSGILIHLVTSITNPSNVTIDVGDVTFDTLFGIGSLISNVGEAIISNLSLTPGTNDYIVTFNFKPGQDPQSQAIGSALLSGFISGGKADLTIKGNVNSTEIQSLKTAFSTIHLNASVQGVPPTLIAESDTYTSLLGLVAHKGVSTIKVNNVFNTPIVLSSTETANVTYVASEYANCTNATLVGDWLATVFGTKGNHSDTPGPPSFTIGPHNASTSDQFTMNFLVTGLTDVRPLVYGLICPNVTSIDGDPKVSGNGTINNRGTVDVSLIATVLIGGPKGYNATIQYAQKGVTINNHFTAPYAAFGLMKTVYCIETTLVNPNCCTCATVGEQCPPPGVCPPLSDGTYVPPFDKNSTIPSTTITTPRASKTGVTSSSSI